jgi:hypothetical protein
MGRDARIGREFVPTWQQTPQQRAPAPAALGEIRK